MQAQQTRWAGYDGRMADLDAGVDHLDTDGLAGLEGFLRAR